MSNKSLETEHPNPCHVFAPVNELNMRNQGKAADFYSLIPVPARPHLSEIRGWPYPLQFRNPLFDATRRAKSRKTSRTIFLRDNEERREIWGRPTVAEARKADSDKVQAYDMPDVHSRWKVGGGDIHGCETRKVSRKKESSLVYTLFRGTAVILFVNYRQTYRCAKYSDWGDKLPVRLLDNPNTDDEPEVNV